MTRLRALLICATLLVAGACTTLPSPDPVTVVPTPAGLQVENRSDAAVYYFALARGALAYTDWRPGVCSAGPNCATVPAHGQLVLPWETLGAPPADGIYSFFWWHAVPDGHGGMVAGEVRGMDVVR
jgi:hypothetical protein